MIKLIKSVKSDDVNSNRHCSVFGNAAANMEVQMDLFSDVLSRLTTFNTWPSDAPAFVKDLVEAGFFYTGQTDRTVCFSCRVEFENWQDEDEPSILHAKASPTCEYLLARGDSIKETTGKSGERSHNDKIIENSNEVMCEERITEAAFNTINMSENSLPQLTDLDKYEVRLGTFATWPSRAPSCIKDLVEAGFYYTGRNDTVCCFNCDLQLSDWLEDESPYQKHRKFSSDCEYISTHGNNSPPPPRKNNLGDDSPSLHDRIPSLHASSDHQAPKHTFDPPQMNVVTQPQPPNIMMRIAENRQQSFVDFPLRHTSIQRSEYADVGLYSTGNGVDVSCFACDLVLAPPDTIEELFMFHKSNSPYCPFLQGAWAGAQCAARKAEKSGGFFSTMREKKKKELCLLGKIGNSIKGVISGTSIDDVDPPVEVAGSSSGGRSTPTHNLTVGSNPKVLMRQRSNQSNRDFKSLTSRLQTFVSFPPNAVVQPSDLAAAGFIYTGVEDGVKCYLCGVTLKNWEDGDTPWGEHLKWSPSCILVANHLSNPDGTDDMNVAPVTPTVSLSDDSNGLPMDDTSTNTASGRYTHRLSSVDRDDDSRMSALSDELPSPSIPRKPQHRSIANGDNSEAQSMSSPTPTTPVAPQSKILEKEYAQLIEMGFSRDIIDKVQNVYLRLFGSLFLSADEVAQAIIYYQEYGNLNGCPASGSSGASATAEELDANPPDVPSDFSSPDVSVYHHAAADDPTHLHNELRRVKEMQLCKICMDSEVAIVFVPCGHLITCPKCANDVKLCPMCRAPIASLVRTYMS